MANELNIQLDPFTENGLTLIAKVYNKTGLQQGSDVTMSFSSSNSGFYTGNFNLSAINDGEYIVRFETSTQFYGSGTLIVKNGAEAVTSTLTSTDISTELATYDAPTKAELDAAQTSIESRLDSAVAGLSTFDPSSDTIEGTLTHNKMMRLLTAALTGKVSGSPDGPIVIKGVDGSTTRISATVDEDGNRTAVTLTP